MFSGLLLDLMGFSMVFLGLLCRGVFVRSGWGLLLRSFTGFWSFLPSFLHFVFPLTIPFRLSLRISQPSSFLSTLTPHHSSHPLRCPSPATPKCSLGTLASRFPCTFLFNPWFFCRCPLLPPVSLCFFSIPLSSVACFPFSFYFCPSPSPFGVPSSTTHTNLT